MFHNPLLLSLEGTMFAVGCSKLKSNLKEEIKHYRKSFFFFYLGFLSRTLTNQGTAGEGGGYLLPLPPTSHALRHQPGDYYRELTSAHTQQQDSNQEPLVSAHKLLTTKLRTLKKTRRISLSKTRGIELEKKEEKCTILGKCGM